MQPGFLSTQDLIQVETLLLSSCRLLRYFCSAVTSVDIGVMVVPLVDGVELLELLKKPKLVLELELGFSDGVLGLNPVNPANKDFPAS